MLRRQGVISSWHDRRITAGSEWSGAIDNHLESARVILLLVSADFLHSDTATTSRCGARSRARLPARLASSRSSRAPSTGAGRRFRAAPGPADRRPSDYQLDEPGRSVHRHCARRAESCEGTAGRPTERREAGHYFAVQRQLIDEHASSLSGGRPSPLRSSISFTRHRRGYFIVSGGPGQGKTALAAYWTSTRGYIHHFVSRSGGRRTSG